MHERASPIGEFFFSRFSTKHDSVDKLRRLSRAASICSEDSENHIDIMDRVSLKLAHKREILFQIIIGLKIDFLPIHLSVQEQPKCQNELLDLVRDLVRVYKKTSQLREVVQNMAWVQVCHICLKYYIIEAIRNTILWC